MTEETSNGPGGDAQCGQVTPQPSGRILLRLPRDLHAQLALEAERQDVSLNMLIVASLAGAVGYKRPRRRRAR